jgi:uncharacterized peroxidase-related enzyme
MARITPLDPLDLGEQKPLLDMMEAAMGFTPSSLLTMAHWPELLSAMGGAFGVILGPGELDPGLKRLISFVTSNAAGCRYCQAHTSHAAQRAGVSAEKIAAAFEFETSPLFSEPERAALRVASRGGMLPNAVKDEDFEDLKRYFNERQIVEIVAAIAIFGFLNRWNDTVATTLEEPPRSFAEQILARHGWDQGKHG